MTVTRSVVMIVLMLLMTFVLVLIHAKDVTTLEYDDLLPATETNARQPNDTDATVGDHRQGRMSLHAELPSSKAKREQALRNILAARRRQILSQRPFEAPRNLNRAPRPGESTLKDSADILEAQETRHGMYVTAPVDIEAGTSNEEESSEISSRVVTKIVPELNKDLGMEFVSKGIEKQVVEQSSMNPNSENDMAPSVENKSASTRNNHSISHRNFSSSSLASSSVVGSNQKSSEMDNRKKNTVSMSESLYNYFRPVESNIPMEDMSQFLYFGQKIQPEIHNTTGNNSVDVTPTVPTVLSSRRRYSMKRFSTTTPVPVPRLEEIINEEMNIAVERQIVEKNKISKIKNTFRSPESGLYYRKTRPTDPTIASNIIPIRELTRNSTETDARTDSPSDKFRDGNPSAHATIQEQLQHERGSATHVLAETRNATNSTQIPHQQPVSANMYEESIVESEISIKDRSVGTSKYTIPTSRVESLKASIDHRGRRKTDNSSIIEAEAPRVENEAKSSIGEATLESNDSAMNMEMHGDYSEQRLMRANVHGTSSFNFSKNIETVQADPPSSSSRESNNIETSTSRDKIPRSTLASFPISWTTSTDTSTLRIIVTEENLTQSSKISTEVEKYTVKPVDSTEQRVRDVASGEIPPPSSSVTTTAASITNSISSESPTLEVTTAGQRKNRQDQQRQNVDQEQHLRHQEQQQQQQQQHVYAYTITNVTRLLRNYTGPGLSREEQGGSQRSTGTAEITTGSPQRRQPPPPSLLLLPRTGSGIEAARAPAELSAGTTVEAVAAGGASAGNLVGERQRKVVAVAPQSQQRAPNRTSLQLTVNKSTSRSNRPTEVTTRGAVRWNHTKVRNSDLEGLNDRRFLRKSASAVLNQRIGANVEEDGSVTSKRRRVTNGLFASSVNSRRIKGTGLFKNREVSSSDRSIDGSSLNSERTNLENKGEVEDVVERQNIQDTMHLGEMTPETEITTVENIMANMEETINTSVASNVTGEVIDVTTPSVVADMLYGDRSNTTESTNLNDEYLKSNTKDKNDVVQNESESAAVSENASSNSRASSADKSTDNTSGSSTVTVTATVETIVAKETTPTATTMPTPVFPVTPKIITEAARVPIEKETFTLKSTESVNRVMETKTTESSKSLEIDNLDPSEIQRQYRPKNVTTETPAVSTTEIENTVSPQDQSTISNSQVEELESSTIFSSTEPRKRISGERSPEVRARNLSDKSKDKDDILPIMHLYNTSDIFNGNGSMDSFSRGTERRVELPVNSQPEVQRTTEKTNDTVTAKSSTKESTNSSRVPLSDTVRKEKHADNRDVPSQVPPTGPGRGSSFVNGNGNRTRHRPVYHHAILPDYNNSLYPNDLNRTFFETGLISVSPRESVNISEVISKRHDGDAIASQETVAVVSYILATLVVFPIAVGVGLILRRLILRNRKVLEESDTSSEISCRKDALNLENGDFKTSIEKAITKLPRIQHLCHEAEKPPPPSSQESRWEFPRDKLRLQTVLGQGNFGQVWKAEADDLTGHQGTTRLVAVKTVKEGASDREKEDLVRELEIMQQLGSHPNVVTLLGCCTEQEPHYLILEYVMYGKLLAYLRDHRTRQDFYNFSEDSAALTSRDLTVFGYCVARGMEYLASKKIIHRDLAARNVLVDHNKLCKIADFGMSRFANEDGEVIETRQGRNALPIRWMAPESLIYSLFTMKTDVWSFGILMWEIVTLGSTPYPDMTAKEVMRNVQNGYRLERPSHCRSELFRVISRCWHADPDRRPEFQTLRRDLTQLLEDNMNGHYVDLESFASECTD